MRNYFSEKSVAEEDLDISKWPPVYTKEMSENEFQLFRKRKLAIDLFFNTDKSVTDIVKETGLNKSEIYRFVNRCITYDNTNKIIGYRGLIPNFKVGNYSRKSFQNTNQETPNYSGSFQLLLQIHPDLKTFLLEEYFNLNMKKSSAREKKISIKNLHRKFIQECRKIGIKPNEYPFNTTSLAKKSVERFIKNISSQYIREVARNSGGQSTMLLNNTNNTTSSNSTIIRPLERVEFDGHKIDAIFAIVYQTPEGEKIVDILYRVWLLTVIDVASRAVVGYHLSLNKEYSKEDVKKCFQAAIIPWEPKELSIQGLKYAKNAGFPSNKFSEAEYGVWDEVCYDNAKSHLSNEVKDLLVKQIGCSINMGPVAVPVRRPIVERLFKTLEENGFHRLPSTTGSNVMDHRRNDAEKNAIKFSITVDSLVELCDVVIANYNASPHDSNYGFSPLEIFESRLEQGVTISQIPREDRSKINLFPISKICSVRGNLQKGRRPYIHYKNVRYTSPELSRDFAMINEEITIMVNTDDLRTVIAYRKDGSEYGVLTAKSKWGTTPHSLKFRDAINKFKRLRYFSYTEDEDPLDAFQAYLEINAINNKNLRNLLAEVKGYKKRYNIDSITLEKKKVVIRVKKEQQDLQQAVIDERKAITSTDNQTTMSDDLLNGYETVHELMLEERTSKSIPAQTSKNLVESNNSQIIESNEKTVFKKDTWDSEHYEELVRSGKLKNKKKRKSITL